MSKGVIGAVLVAVLLGSTGASAQSTLALEGASVSFSQDFGGESPPGSALQHDVSLDGSDPAFGLSFATRVTRHVGIRVGALTGTLPVSGRMACPNPTCDFMVGNARVSISGGVEFTTADDGDLQIWFVEVPIGFEPRPGVDLFVGPTLARVDVDGSETPGTNGLGVEVDSSYPSFGLHLGGAVHYANWTAGLVARWIPVEVEVGVRLPTALSLGTLFSEESDVDLLSIGLMVGRRFGLSNR